MLRTRRARQRSEIGQTIQRQIHLEGRAFDAETSDRPAELSVQVRGVDQLEEGHFGVEIGCDDVRLVFVAVFKYDAMSAAVPHQHTPDGCIHANLNAFGARGRGDRLRDSSHPAFHESPQAALASHAAHAMVHQDVGSPGGTRSAIRANDAVRRERHFDLRRFEPLIEKISCALGEDFYQPGDLARAELAESPE